MIVYVYCFKNNDVYGRTTDARVMAVALLCNSTNRAKNGSVVLATAVVEVVVLAVALHHYTYMRETTVGTTNTSLQ